MSKCRVLGKLHIVSGDKRVPYRSDIDALTYCCFGIVVSEALRLGLTIEVPQKRPS